MTKSSTAKKTERIREAYVDTSAFIAFLDRSDSHHLLFRRLFSAPPRLVTSALVVAEGHGWFLRRYDGNRALQFLQFLEALPAMTIVPFDSADLKSATKVVQKFSDQSLTLADAHGLVIMTARGVPICWSMDRHLSLTGVKLAI